MTQTSICLERKKRNWRLCGRSIRRISGKWSLQLPSPSRILSSLRQDLNRRRDQLDCTPGPAPAFGSPAYKGGRFQLFADRWQNLFPDCSIPAQLCKCVRWKSISHTPPHPLTHTGQIPLPALRLRSLPALLAPQALGRVLSDYRPPFRQNISRWRCQLQFGRPYKRANGPSSWI